MQRKGEGSKGGERRRRSGGKDVAFVAEMAANAAAATRRSGRIRCGAEGRGGRKKVEASAAARGRRGAVGGMLATVILGMGTKQARAEEEGKENELVQQLLKKSMENKAKNDAERRDYSKQYESYLAIEFFGNPPKDPDVRKKYGVEKRPVECNLKFFQKSKLCQLYE